jgi:hypothetical protein
MFAGPGAALTDVLLKDDAGGTDFHLAPSNEPADVEGLSCRWEPLQPTYGVMLTLMAASADGENVAVFTELRKRIQAAMKKGRRQSATAHCGFACRQPD